MTGVLIYVMGPSGAGKNTLIEIAKIKFAGTKSLRFAERHVRREAGGDGAEFAAVGWPAFDYLEKAGEFVFVWRDRGLVYGLDRRIETWLDQGQVVVVNGPGAYLSEAMKVWPDLKPVLITVRPEVAAARLKMRGRASTADQAERLNPPGPQIKKLKTLQTIDNSDALEAAADLFCALLAKELARNAARPKELRPEPLVDETALVVDSTLGAWTEIGSGCELHGVEFGDYSYTGTGCHLMYCRVGKFVNIANNVRVNPSNHPYRRATLHHFTYRSHQYGFGPDDETIFAWRRNEQKVTIGHDVWLGHGTIILPGVTVGHGAIVAAGAVVSKDVEPYTIVAGVPAQKIKRRFPRKVAEKIEALAWWDWSHDELRDALSDFRGLDILGFIEKYRRNGKCGKVQSSF